MAKEIVIISISPERMVDGKPVRFLNKMIQMSTTGERTYTFDNDSQYAIMIPVNEGTIAVIAAIEADFANGAESVTISQEMVMKGV